jgi:hypothetical protein
LWETPNFAPCPIKFLVTQNLEVDWLHQAT